MGHGNTPGKEGPQGSSQHPSNPTPPLCPPRSYSRRRWKESLLPMLWASSAACSCPQITALPGRGEGPGPGWKMLACLGAQRAAGVGGQSCRDPAAQVGAQRPLAELLVANGLQRPGGAGGARRPAGEAGSLGEGQCQPRRALGQAGGRAQRQHPRQRESVCSCSSGWRVQESGPGCVG